jgi:AhpD family alkylhydroperoxidase
MSERVKYARVAPEAVRAMKALQDYVNATGLEHSLLELVKLRASYMNGCAYCVDMHTKDSRAAGETEQRLYMVPVWREAPFYTDRERAALAWTEAVTRVDVSDAEYEHALVHFTEKELVELTMAVVAINGWNRLSVTFQTEVGSYRPLVRAS